MRKQYTEDGPQQLGFIVRMMTGKAPMMGRSINSRLQELPKEAFAE
ncbi:hypothetical protein [Arthrobacter rhombi]